MRVSKGSIVRAFSTGRAPAQPYVRGSSNRRGMEDSAPEPSEDVLWRARQLPRNDETIVRDGPAQTVRTPGDMKGMQPCACI
jgi:hypothetical protein